MKKLKEPAEPLERFLGAVARLGEKLGPLLFQLPPRWRVNPERLAAFLDALPEGRRFAFEFRDESWWRQDIYRLLAGRDVAFCAYDLGGRRSPAERTASYCYVRLHGPGGPYSGQYDGRTLAGWAKRISGWLAQGCDVYCYFDNDEAAYAPHDALRLREMLG